ncbi:CinA family protein [Pseudofrankia asymbiotica]|uniref:CinA C-terminal domain-containing protein n=1 Tax=Pseudofrankia asymbiotica TaxID=1834516 RepID=A0A1V2I1I1_9ACTN|nr:CinA family protein [Pseudofrankia asymbiotica]ONH23665.1 hypothetical protein BL253_32400 [Pseudofrankia asymbiotica]
MADLAHGRLVDAGRTVAVAESLTGGLVSVVLTAAPGTNATFRGGLVVYATDLKHTAAGVPQADIERHGPVHPVVAERLAAGVRERLSADYGIGVTGVAGPGEQARHPVGEVFVSIGSEAGTSVTRHQFEGSRDDIRLAAAIAALSDLVRALDTSPTTST